MVDAVAKSPPLAWPRDWQGVSPQIFDAQHHEVVVVGIDDDAVGTGEVTVGGSWDVLHRDGIVDIAADHIKVAGLDRDDDVAMARKAVARQLVIGYRFPAAPVADQITALRSV